MEDDIEAYEKHITKETRRNTVHYLLGAGTVVVGVLLGASVAQLNTPKK